MTTWTPRIAAPLLVAAMGTLALIGPAAAQGPDGVPGDRLVVPLPDLSGLDGDQAQEMARRLARAGLVTAECPAYDVSDPEWQLLTGSTDAVMKVLGVDAVTFDRDYVRPEFAAFSESDACDRLGPDVAVLITELEERGGSAQPVTPEPATPEPAAPQDPATPDAQPDADAPAE